MVSLCIKLTELLYNLSYWTTILMMPDALEDFAFISLENLSDLDIRIFENILCKSKKFKTSR